MSFPTIFKCSFPQSQNAIRSQAIACTVEDRARRWIKVEQYALDANVRSGTEEKQSRQDNEDVQRRLGVAPEALGFHKGDATVDVAHAEVCYAPEDESEETVEEGGHEG